ncbi:MAG: hypothetical protein CYPHOPRED_004266 [Cyphobasidiales sp. Tagirdzhanova-0007]|nr:MAG: hypothetical protein CYPHOPRED_004266 [Cyphobasidiales sp. Tagirdzhanova-0007]
MSDVVGVENIAQERAQVYTHVAFKMVQATALVAPPFSLARQMQAFQGIGGTCFSVNRWLRNNAAWTIFFGSTAGLAMAWGRLRNESDIAIHDRAYRLRHNSDQVRVDDYSKVGAILGALITTTIFLRRASLVNNILGGATLGIVGGIITHTAQMVREQGAEGAAKDAQRALPDPVAITEGVTSGKP